jgi:hypothetical protein
VRLTRAIVLVVALLAVAGCGGGDSGSGGSGNGGGGNTRYQYHLFLPAPVGDVQGATVVVDGQEQGTVQSAEPAGASNTNAEIGLDSPLHVTARTRVCKGQLRITSGSATTPLAQSGYTFPLGQATVAAGGAACS